MTDPNEMTLDDMMEAFVNQLVDPDPTVLLGLAVSGLSIQREEDGPRYEIFELEMVDENRISRHMLELHQLEALRDMIDQAIEKAEQEYPEFVKNAREFHENADEHTFLDPRTQQYHDTINDRCECERCQARRQAERDNANC